MKFNTSLKNIFCVILSSCFFALLGEKQKWRTENDLTSALLKNQKTQTDNE